MSRIGKSPIPVPSGVNVAVDERRVTVTGPKGTLSRDIPGAIELRQEDGTVYVERPDDARQNRSLHGLTRTLVNNMVVGVTDGFSKELEIVGVGYRADAARRSSPRARSRVQPSRPGRGPRGHHLRGPAPTRVIVRGIDKEKVGQVAADIRAIRKPEPYKGKGVRYAGERVQRKAGKAGK